MDVDALLNIEKRTGIKDADIDDFLDRVTAVERQIKGLLSGDLDPRAVKIDDGDDDDQGPNTASTVLSGSATARSAPAAPTETAEQREARRVEAERKLEQAKAEGERRRMLEERHGWWTRAQLWASGLDEGAPEEAQASKPVPVKRDPLDYSKWDRWVPDDPATREEAEERKAAEERARDEEFEKANPEFCSQVKSDMAKRKEATETKAQRCERFKAEGNALLQRGRAQDAVRSYASALDSEPMAAAVLANMAQAFLSMGRVDQCVDFCDRVLFVATHGRTGGRPAPATDADHAAAPEAPAPDLACSPSDVAPQLRALAAKGLFRRARARRAQAQAADDSAAAAAAAAKANSPAEAAAAPEGRTATPPPAASSALLRMALRDLRAAAELQALDTPSAPAGAVGKELKELETILRMRREEQRVREDAARLLREKESGLVASTAPAAAPRARAGRARAARSALAPTESVLRAAVFAGVQDITALLQAGFALQREAGAARPRYARTGVLSEAGGLGDAGVYLRAEGGLAVLGAVACALATEAEALAAAGGGGDGGWRGADASPDDDEIDALCLGCVAAASRSDENSPLLVETGALEAASWIIRAAAAAAAARSAVTAAVASSSQGRPAAPRSPAQALAGSPCGRWWLGVLDGAFTLVEECSTSTSCRSELRRVSGLPRAVVDFAVVGDGGGVERDWVLAERAANVVRNLTVKGATAMRGQGVMRRLLDALGQSIDARAIGGDSAAAARRAARAAVAGALTNLSRDEEVRLEALDNTVRAHSSAGAAAAPASAERAVAVLLPVALGDTADLAECVEGALATLLNCTLKVTAPDATAGQGPVAAAPSAVLDAATATMRSLAGAGAARRLVERLATVERGPDGGVGSSRGAAAPAPALDGRAAEMAARLLARLVSDDAEARTQAGQLPLVRACCSLLVSGASPARQQADAAQDSAVWGVREHAARVLVATLQTREQFAAAAAADVAAGTLALLRHVSGLRPDARAASSEGAPPEGRIPRDVPSTRVATATSLLISLTKDDPARDPSLLPALRDGGVVAPVIALLAAAPDGPLRQNAAIALARLARDPAAKEQIRAQRGLEMLVQLGVTGSLSLQKRPAGPARD